MKTKAFLLIFLLHICFFHTAKGQGENTLINDSIIFDGLASVLYHYNEVSVPHSQLDCRYIPQLKYQMNFKKSYLLDFDFSPNYFYRISFNNTKDYDITGKFALYRSWIRFSGKQFECRVGLQKINFGSAALLRPLMWFDQLDPKDPMQITNGVWGLLGRYYFLNNANIWAWSLYGNSETRPFDIGITNDRKCEFGSRIQVPLWTGEIGTTYHYREMIYKDIIIPLVNTKKSPEHKFGLDAKFDYIIGFWVEASWLHFEKYLNDATNREMMTIGADYTIPVGSGIGLMAENMWIFTDKNAFSLQNQTAVVAASIRYPFSINDQLQAYTYSLWDVENTYYYLQWKHQFKKFSSAIVLYANPNYTGKMQPSIIANNLYGGKGIQAMLIFNH